MLHVCVCVRVCVLDGEGSRVFAVRALLVLILKMLVCLTNLHYSYCLTSFREPLLPYFRCYTCLKNVLRDHCFS